ncbi:MAG: DNA polymerase III subunit beta [Clostridium sp.]|nr:DNA polymerase III subunit beta [Clostridium sp.]
MKFNVPSKALYGLISNVSKVINSKNALQILNNFYFELRGTTLSVKGSDQENSLVGSIEVLEAEGEGSFCSDARRMLDMLREIPDQGIVFDIDESTFEMKVTYRNGVYNTVAIPGNEYPVASAIVASPDETVSFIMPTSQMLQGIEKTLFAVSDDDSHPQMMGILWDIKPTEIIFVATDTRKLVRYSNATAAPGVEASFILPFKPANVLKNVFTADCEMKVTLTPRTACFETVGYTFVCQLIKGNYPDYNRVIPKKNPYTVTIDRAQFLSAVRRVNAFVDTNNSRVTFKLLPSEIIMKAQDQSYNTSGQESVECEFDGPEMFIAFSAHFLIEILNTLTTSDILIRLADQSRAAVILPSENDENTDLLMLLMPMFLQEF